MDVSAEGGVDATVMSNNVEAGRQAGQYIVDRLKGKGDVVIINGPPVSSDYRSGQWDSICVQGEPRYQSALFRTERRRQPGWGLQSDERFVAGVPKDRCRFCNQ